MTGKWSDMQMKQQAHEVLQGHTLEAMKPIIAEHLGVDAATITAETDFLDQLGADSLDMVELVMAFEEEFKLETIEDHEVDKVRTIQDAIDLIEKKRK